VRKRGGGTYGNASLLVTNIDPVESSGAEMNFPDVRLIPSQQARSITAGSAGLYCIVLYCTVPVHSKIDRFVMIHESEAKCIYIHIYIYIYIYIYILLSSGVIILYYELCTRRTGPDRGA